MRVKPLTSCFYTCSCGLFKFYSGTLNFLNTSAVSQTVSHICIHIIRSSGILIDDDNDVFIGFKTPFYVFFCS